MKEIDYTKAESVWSATSTLPRFPTLTKDVKTKVLIIGGGIAGILTAYMLAELGIDYILVESKTLCHGVTKNTTAKITSQHGLIYDKLSRRFGLEKAELYLQANEEAIKRYKILCENIDCDYEEKDSYVYSVSNSKALLDEIHTLQKINFGAEFEEKIELPLKTVGAVKFPHQAQFNPLKFISAISRNLNIFEYTKVKELIGNKAITEGGTIDADNIIVTTHFPFLNKHGSYFLKMYQQRSYVIALENAPNYRGMYIDEAKNGLSFRNYKNLLLLGGGGHRTGKKGGNWQELRNFYQTYLPMAKEKYIWAAQDCMTLDNLPYIGQYSKSTKNLYVATGFNKWGMTSAMVSAVLSRDLILGRDNKYLDLFSPSRSILRPQLFINALESTKNLLTPTTPRCPHLGCALKWNSAEHSWDCPCHGSRFSEDGELLDNPATDDLKNLKR